MAQAFLSDIELYYSTNVAEEKGIVILDGNEFKHCVKVMRNAAGNTISVTDGKGVIYECVISELNRNSAICKIEKKRFYGNEMKGITFVVPRMKKNDRFEFALEKCVELGIIDFIVYQADKSIAKGDKTERWRKTLLSAMKQSLRAYLPTIKYLDSLDKLDIGEGDTILFFHQHGEQFNTDVISQSGRIFFLFGPEGGFSEREISLFENSKTIRLTENRLRSETAIIAAAVKISIK